jgi:hypothetical protein
MKPYKTNRDDLIENLRGESRGMAALERRVSQREIDFDAPGSPHELDLYHLEASLGATSALLNEAANFIEDNIRTQ